jgi:hypothetical protein
MEESVYEASVAAADVLGAANPEKPTVQSVIQTNLSTDLLLRIAEELSSIRQELSTLKQDFLAIRAHEPAISALEPAVRIAELVEIPSEVKKEEALPQNAQGGFFDDSDDEKIALTGNELDNILLSADFTEEIGMDISKGEPEAVELEASPEEAEALQNAQGGFFDDSDDEKIALTGRELDNVLMSADFTEETGEDLSEEAPEVEPVPETDEGASFEIEEVILDSSTGTDELRRLLEEGVESITPAPEDSSYLEADPVAHQELQELEVEDIDLSDVVIDEPDLSGQLQENPLQEPVLEAIAFDDMPLDISEEEPAEPIAEEYPDMEPLPEEKEPAEPIAEEYPVAETLSPVGESAQNVAVPAEMASETAVSGSEPIAKVTAIPSAIQQELKTVLSYMDQLLESLPEEKIEEFAASKYFDTYKKLFSELGLV